MARELNHDKEVGVLHKRESSVEMRDEYLSLVDPSPTSTNSPHLFFSIKRYQGNYVFSSTLFGAKEQERRWNKTWISRSLSHCSCINRTWLPYLSWDWNPTNSYMILHFFDLSYSESKFKACYQPAIFFLFVVSVTEPFDYSSTI